MAREGETTILVVNDDPDQLDFLSMLLQATGYYVVTATDGQEGIEVARESQPGLVISDVAMPKMDGIELCRQLRSDVNLRTVPILLVSANRKDTQSAVDGLHAGADDYLELPYEPMRLIAQVARLIERARSEEALRESEERFRGTFDQAAVGIAHVSTAGKWLLVNRKLCDIVGYSADELRNLTFQAITHPDDLEADLSGCHQLLAGEISNYIREKRYIRKDGDVVWVELTSSITRDKNGNPKYFITVIEDISERKQAEQALLLSEERYRLLFETNPHPMWVYDTETLEFLAVNEAAVRHYGYAPQEFLRMTVSDVVLLEEVPSLLRAVTDTGPGPVSRGVWKHRKKSGSPIDVELVSHALRFGTRNAELVLAHDVTEQKAAEEALRHSEEQLQQSQKLEAVGRLAGGLAHDFNNIMTAIGGYSDLVLRRLAEQDPLRRNIEEIKKAAQRAATLTHQLLAFSRKQVMQLRLLDLNSVVIDLESLLRRLIGEDIDLVIDLQPGLGPVRADPSQLGQVIMNLVVNARDAMPDGGKLVIETSESVTGPETEPGQPSPNPGPYVRFTISDTGSGMDATTQKRIFEPFFTTKPAGKGTGLGLSMVYGIVKQSEGAISVSSELGKGTTFRIHLPLIQGTIERVENRSVHRSVLRGTESVLVVEDEQMVRELVTEILEAEGYEVMAAHRGYDALRLGSEVPGAIDLLITDVVMPEMSGRELAERLLEQHPETKLLFISGYTDDAIVRYGISEAEMAFLQKPFTPDELIRKVRDILDETDK
jgi:two-component system cell cycle sensor histidine kinase/response regulator CckA